MIKNVENKEINQDLKKWQYFFGERHFVSIKILLHRFTPLQPFYISNADYYRII
jgi:hypothetical protein